MVPTPLEVEIGEASRQPAAEATPAVVTVSLDLEKRPAIKELRRRVPEVLRARCVSEDEWRAVCDRLLEFQEDSYWVGQLLLQNSRGTIIAAAKKANAAITDVLSRHSVHCAVTTDAPPKAEFWTH